MIFDTHLHLNDEHLLGNLDEYIKEARLLGVTSFLCIGWDLESSKKAIEIAEKYPFVYAAVAVMPTEHKKYNLLGSENATIDSLRELAKSSKKVIAIGEIGLDFYWENEPEIKEKQIKMFNEQIDLANELNLPVSIHARNADQATFDILKTHKVNQAGIMHCYSGSYELAKEYIKIGFKIAFGGVLTFKNSKVTKEVIQKIGLENIVFETDAPYLAPTPYRGKMNEPKYIKKTVEYASELLNVDLDELEKITYKNSLKILHVENYD